MAKCKNCKQEYKKYRPLQNVCGYECSIELSKARMETKKAKAWAKEKAKRKEALKTREDYFQETLKAFNTFIRARDLKENCISCDAKAGTYRLTSGHFYPQGTYRNIALDERNANGQCWYNCNKNKSGNLLEYRPRLIKKIGLEAVEQLDIDAQQKVGKQSIEELKELKQYYKAKAKELNKNS